jgi:transposase InsO family protein
VASYYSIIKRECVKEVKISLEQEQKVIEIFQASRNTYGIRRILAQLRNEGETEISREVVSEIMRRNGLKSVYSQRIKHRVRTTNSRGNKRIAKNILNRDFAAVRTNEKWCGDATYIPTDECWLYFSTVLDLFLRKLMVLRYRQRKSTKFVRIL